MAYPGPQGGSSWAGPGPRRALSPEHVPGVAKCRLCAARMRRVAMARHRPRPAGGARRWPRSRPSPVLPCRAPRPPLVAAPARTPRRLSLAAGRRAARRPPAGCPARGRPPRPPRASRPCRGPARRSVPPNSPPPRRRMPGAHPEAGGGAGVRPSPRAAPRHVAHQGSISPPAPADPRTRSAAPRSGKAPSRPAPAATGGSPRRCAGRWHPPARQRPGAPHGRASASADPHRAGAPALANGRPTTAGAVARLSRPGTACPPRRGRRAPGSSAQRRGDRSVTDPSGRRDRRAMPPAPWKAP